MSIQIGNKRATQLIQLSAAEVMPDDLFYIVDISARESKKIPASQLSLYLSVSGSLYAIHSILADTASYVLGSGVDGAVALAVTSSFTGNSATSSISRNSDSASWSTTASYALNASSGNTQTASYLKYQGFNNGTASFALTSSLTINCLTSSFLQYTIGANNGTASYSIRTQNVDHATSADTASYFNGAIGTVAHATLADTATNAVNSTYANSASYLIYGDHNGTASYALKAGAFAGTMLDYGVFLALTQSNIISSLDNVNVNPASNTAQPTSVEAVGTIVVPYTSSILVNESVALVVKSRDSGVETTLDSTPIYINVSPTTGDWSTLTSGSTKIPVTLLGQSNLVGQYQVYLTASNARIYFEPTRTARFNISSQADALSVSTDVPLLFWVSPTSSLIRFSSSLAAGAFSDYLPGLYATGSNNITVVNVSNTTLADVKYIWTLSNLREFVANSNFPLTNIPGLPNSVATMSCYSCSLLTISSMSNIPTMSYFLCNDNDLATLPALPVSLSYLDCSRNFITSLPSRLPGGLRYLNCTDNLISSVPLGISASSLNALYMDSCSLTTVPIGYSFPPLLYTMSFAYNPSLTNISPNWPISMSYLDITKCSVNDVPSMPSSASFIRAYSSSLDDIAIENLASGLVGNGLSNGYLDIRGTGIPSSTALVQLGTLSVRGWTVLKDT